MQMTFFSYLSTFFEICLQEMDFLSVLCQFAIVQQVYTRGCGDIELSVFVGKEV